VGDYVIVHVGFALSRLDAEEALRTLELLKEMGALKEEGLEGNPTGGG
jgi:hydrogenase expression/formation protein HypC